MQRSLLHARTFERKDTFGVLTSMTEVQASGFFDGNGEDRSNVADVSKFRVNVRPALELSNERAQSKLSNAPRSRMKRKRRIECKRRQTIRASRGLLSIEIERVLVQTVRSINLDEFV